MYPQTHFTSKGVETESWNHLPRGREGVKPWELPKLGLEGNYLSGLIISTKIDLGLDLVFFFFLWIRF